MTISDRIQKRRMECGLSQNQLAKLMDVSRQAVSKWENGLSTPDPAKVIQLAQILEVDLAYLVTGQSGALEPQEICPQIIEKIVEVPVIEYVDRIQIKRIIRKQRYRNPIEYIIVGLICFLMGILIGWIL